MSAVPRYVQRAREALQNIPTSSPVCEPGEKSERSEKSPRFRPGQRYKFDGPLLGTIRPADAAFDTWREQMGLPRAGIMTIEGIDVIVADVRYALLSGYFDVIAVRADPLP